MRRPARLGEITRIKVRDPMDPGLWGYLCANSLARLSVLATVVLVLGVFLFRKVWTRQTRLRTAVGALGVAGCTTLYAVTAAELLEIAHHAILRASFNPVLRSAVVTTVLLAGAVVLLRRVWTCKSRGLGLAIRFGVSVCTVVYAVGLAELALYLFFAEPHGAGATLTAKRWAEKHWHPINAAGYRDVEHGESDLAGKKLMFVLGNSFAAGGGIADVSNRFSNLLQDKLGGRWVVANVAKPGWNTGEQYEALVTSAPTPDALVLAYTYNDIDGVAVRAGFSVPRAHIRRPNVSHLRSWVDHSHLANLLYWWWYAHSHPDTYGDFWRCRKQCYADDDIFNAHKRELLDITDDCENGRIALFVLIIPNLLDVEGSRPITTRVARVFSEHGVPVVDLTDSLAGRDPADLVVNASDPHANEQVNREIAGQLFDVIGAARLAMHTRP